MHGSTATLLLALLPALAWSASDGEPGFATLHEPAPTAIFKPASSTPATATSKPPTIPAAITKPAAPARPITASSAPAASYTQNKPIPAKPLVTPPLKHGLVKPAAPHSAPVASHAAKPVAAAPLHVLPAKPVIGQPVIAKPAIPIPAASNVAPMSAPDPLTPPPQVTAPISDTMDIEFFTREDCEQCDKAKEFLKKLHDLQPKIKIATRDVRREPAALNLLKRMAENQNNSTLDYPAFIVEGQLIIGFTEENNTAQQILDTLAVNNPDSETLNEDAESCSTGKEPSCGLIPAPPAPKQESISLGLFGYNIPLRQIGLPLFTLAMGVLDGFNFGTTWVLLLMVGLLAPLKNRSLMLTITGTFILVQGLIYFAVLAAWFNLLLLLDITRITQFVFAGIAFLAAAVYFKNYLSFDAGLNLHAQEISKLGIYTRIRKIVEAENIYSAVIATLFVAAILQLGELSYKSVFPALYTRVLMLQHLNTLGNYAYLLLYDFAYMMDDILVLLIGVAALRQSRAQDNKGRILIVLSMLTLVCSGIYFLLERY
jgi:glutaredoxin